MIFKTSSLVFIWKSHGIHVKSRYSFTWQWYWMDNVISINSNFNKTAGYHRHFLRLPSLVKMQLWKLKTFFVFLSKKHFIFIIISNFSNVQSSRFSVFFCQINLIMRAENTFLRNITILYAFYSKSTTFGVFEKLKIFFKNFICFFETKPKFWTFLEILLFQSHSTANLLQLD